MNSQKNVKKKNEISIKKLKQKLSSHKFQNSIKVSVRQCQDLVTIRVR